jgi:hypothetical protein
METKERRSSKAMAKGMLLLRKREKNSHINIVQKMAMMKTIVGNFILKEDQKSLATKKGKSKTTTTVQHDLGSDSGDETKITTMGLSR